MSRDALVVGISHYQYAQDIAAAARDAEAIAQILDKFGGFNVTLFPEAY